MVSIVCTWISIRIEILDAAGLCGVGFSDFKAYVPKLMRVRQEPASNKNKILQAIVTVGFTHLERRHIASRCVTRSGQTCLEAIGTGLSKDIHTSQKRITRK